MKNLQLRILILALILPWFTVPAASTDLGGSSDEAIQRSIERKGEAYSHMMRALFIAKQGHAGQAVREINEAIKLDPDSPDLKAEAASLLLQMGQQQQAERLVRQALRIEPDHHRSLSILADILTQGIMSHRGDREGLPEVISVYERLVKLPNPEPDYFRLLTTFHLRIGNIEGALETARSFVETHQGDPQAVRMLANVLLHADQDALAVQEVVHFLADTEGLDEASAGFKDAVALLDNLVRSQDAWGQMVELGARLIETRPTTGELRALYGEALLRTGKAVEAGIQMEAALQLANQDPMLRYQLATVYGGLGRSAEAVALAHALVEEHPRHPQVRSLLGEMLEQQDRSREAIQSYGEALELMSGDPTEVVRRDDLRHRIILLHLSMEEPEKARATLATLENVTSRQALELASNVAIAMGDWVDASKFADRLRDSGEDGAGLLLEAEIRAMAGETGRARKLFSESERHIGNGARYRAVEVFYRSGNPEIGLSIVENWSDEEPDNPLVQYYLGQYLDRLGKYKQGDRALREAIRLDPDYSDAMNHLGYSLAERGVKLDEALELIRKALARHPWNAAYLDSLGWVYYQQGLYDLAIEPLEQAARERPADSTVLDHLGDLYHKIGRVDSALESWRTALKSGHGNQSETIEEKIASLLREGR